jgi:Zn-dependent metalloprotease
MSMRVAPQRHAVEAINPVGTFGTPGAGPLCGITPPQLFRHYLDNGTQEQRAAAARALAATAAVRAKRELIQRFSLMAQVAPTGTGKRESVYDAQHTRSDQGLPGKLLRTYGDPPVGDQAADEAYDGADATFLFYQDVFSRNSIDGSGLEIVSSVHYSVDLDNAMWDGKQMLYGDGGQFLQNLPGALDVCGHELTHGVTQSTANLIYDRQSGALNESMSDVFGSLVKQYKNKQSADQADWLIGEGTLRPEINGKALRSMAEPGTAFEGDTQPGTMSGYDEDGGRDNGGVHRNSGIPNRAFYLAATAIGGNAWEQAGQVWYIALTEKLRANADFKTAAQVTADIAREQFGDDSAEHKAVLGAWEQVGVTS